MTSPGRRLALSALFIIFIANFFSYLDRQLVSAVERPIRDAINLSQTEFGLLWTLFTVGYMVFAIPIGFLADRYNRPRILAFCIIVWSLATVASGMAQGRPVLYVSRFLIGMGEAGCLVVGQSLIADFFDARVRGKALSVFHLAVPIGGTAAFILAGVFLKDAGPDAWRTLFYVAGAPGILIALVLLALPDPPRGGGGHAKTGFREYVQLFKTPTLMLVILAQAFAVITLVPLIHFGAEFFQQRLSIAEDKARIAMGILALVAGGLGTFLSGVLGDWLGKRWKGGYAALAGVSFLVGMPFLLLGFNATTQATAFPFLGIGAFCIFLCMPAVNTQIANVTHPARRAMAWSLAVFVLHLLGDTTAPLVFGKVSDAIGHEKNSEMAGRLAAFTYFTFSLLLAGICCLIAARTAAKDIAKLEKPNPGDMPAPNSVV